MTHKPVYRPSIQSIVLAVALGVLGWTVIVAGMRSIL